MLEIDLVKYLGYLFQKKWIIFLIVVILTGSSLVYCMLAQKTYSSKVVLLPRSLGSEQGQSQFSLPGISSSLLNMGGSSSNDDLLSSILYSRTFLSSLQDVELQLSDSSYMVLKTFYGVDTVNNRTMPSYMDRLQSAIQFEKGDKKGGHQNFEYILTIKGKDPTYIFNLAKFIVPYLDSTWMNFITSKMDRDINTVQLKLNHAKKSLYEAESKLVYFSEKNKGFGTPKLRRKMQELTRDVKVNESKYLMVYDKLQSLELEKLSLSPKMTVLDSAYIPFRHIAPQRKLIVTATFISSFAVSCLILFIFFIIKENRDPEVSS